MGKREKIAKPQYNNDSRTARRKENTQSPNTHDEVHVRPESLSDERLSHPANAALRAQILGDLQRSHGNAYVQRLLAPLTIQAKLTVSSPGDEYEIEADTIADTVTRAARTEAQRQPIQEEEEEAVQMKRLPGIQRQEMPEEEKMQMKSEGFQEPTVSAEMETRINTARGNGAILPDSIRSTLEPQFGYDFSKVRIHTDANSNDLSEHLDARAFTIGNDIFFRSGDYQPDSEDGMKLLAHEMTHVVQQGAAVPMVSPETLLRKDIEEEEESPGTEVSETTGGESAKQAENTAAENEAEQSESSVEAEAPAPADTRSRGGGSARQGFDPETAAQMRDRMMRPIEQAAEEALSASPPDVRRAISLIAEACAIIAETPLEDAISPDAAARMRHQILTPLEQAGETLSATADAPERAMSLLGQAIVNISSLPLESGQR